MDGFIPEAFVPFRAQMNTLSHEMDELIIKSDTGGELLSYACPGKDNVLNSYANAGSAKDIKSRMNYETGSPHGQRLAIKLLNRLGKCLQTCFDGEVGNMVAGNLLYFRLWSAMHRHVLGAHYRDGDVVWVVEES